MKVILASLAGTILLTAGTTADAADAPVVVRHPMGSFPISAAVEVPPGYATIYLSGVGPDPADKAVDTETQTRSEIVKLSKELTAMGLGLGDIVQMHVYLAPDPKLGKMDFPGMMKAYKEFFGTKAQPNLPARAAFQVAGLALPTMLVEIEAIAARKP
jgi:enamine deaminase RidA (YjgF/YER057c/UK114 family)